MVPAEVPGVRLIWTLTMTVPAGLVCVTCPDQLPPRRAGMVGVGPGDPRGRSEPLVRPPGWFVGAGLVVAACGLLPFCAARTATAIAAMHTAIPIAHQIVTARRGGFRRGPGPGRGCGSGAGRSATRAERLSPSP